ncbi:MAG TPA: biopolymer transporter ExbD [Labilithrix sp.]|nr:biopolymer transporter ExbD [Labilithrix sp.]
MSVQAPGRIDRGGLGLRRGGLGRAVARALPSSAPLGGGRKRLLASLSMTSMIDVLVVMTVFLLLTFQSSPQCGGMRDLSQIPPAGNVYDIVDAPIVHVAASGGVIVDGSLAASSEELEEQRGRVARLDGLFNLLKQKHELARTLRPGAEPNTHVILAIDGDVPASVVKSIVMTAAHSGYPSIDFMVHAAPKG